MCIYGFFKYFYGLLVHLSFFFLVRFFLALKNIPFLGSIAIYSPSEEHPGCFQVSVMRNEADTKIHAFAFCGHCFYVCLFK